MNEENSKIKKDFKVLKILKWIVIMLLALLLNIVGKVLIIVFISPVFGVITVWGILRGKFVVSLNGDKREINYKFFINGLGKLIK